MDTTLTIREALELLNPPMTRMQLASLIILASIEPAEIRRTRRSGRPAAAYPAARIMQAHGEEFHRTSRPFDGGDWIAHALLARNLITTDLRHGELHWPDGTRAETLRADYYGAVRVGQCHTAAHRLIWIAADGEIPAGIQVNHINKLRWDNRRANLELVTHANNIWHAHGYPYQNTSDEGRAQECRSRRPRRPKT